MIYHLLLKKIGSKTDLVRSLKKKTLSNLENLKNNRKTRIF